jgi:putative transport protein
MEFIVELLQNNPILLLFLVSAIGYPLGRIKVKGISLGVAAVLFVGLIFGALDTSLKLPEIIYKLGLVLFVYCIGLSSGPMFFSSIRKNGLLYNLLIVICLLLSTGMTIGFAVWFGFLPAATAGLFSGSLTNTPALAAVLEHLQSILPAAEAEMQQSNAIVAYSIAYPLGVVGVIVPIYMFQRIWKINYSQDLQHSQITDAGNEDLLSCTVEITHNFQNDVQQLIYQHGWNVIFGRHQSNGNLALTQHDTQFSNGDYVHVIANADELEKIISILGKKEENLQLDQNLSTFDKFRVFVSNQDIAGKLIKDIPHFMGPDRIITRIRRGDREFLPHGDTVLYLGDQLRFVTKRENIEAIRKLCGDSFKAISEFNVLSLGIGIVLGLLIGEIPIPLPGGVTLKLGIAGGPLIMALILGMLGRTGKFSWTIPYSANLVLRQIGLILFLAGVGTRSGYAFISTLQSAEGIYLFLSGAIITGITASLAIWIGTKWMKIPFGVITGILAGMHTQPAVLAFANEQADNELPNLGYAMVFPVAMIVKILLAQIILVVLLGL